MYQVLRACIAPKTAINDRENNNHMQTVNYYSWWVKLGQMPTNQVAAAATARLGESDHQIRWHFVVPKGGVSFEASGTLRLLSSLMSLLFVSLPWWLLTACPKSTSAASLPQGRAASSQSWECNNKDGGALRCNRHHKHQLVNISYRMHYLSIFTIRKIHGWFFSVGSYQQ